MKRSRATKHKRGARYVAPAPLEVKKRTLEQVARDSKVTGGLPLARNYK